MKKSILPIVAVAFTVSMLSAAPLSADPFVQTEGQTQHWVQPGPGSILSTGTVTSRSTGHSYTEGQQRQPAGGRATIGGRAQPASAPLTGTRAYQSVFSEGQQSTPAPRAR